MAAELVCVGLAVLGFCVGAGGTLIGVGGGFVLVPLLLLLYPSDDPALITSISLAVVFFNALSGSAAYIHQRRVDFLAGNAFAAATVPGAIAGALVVDLLPREMFDAIFALLLIAAAVYLQVRPASRIVVRRSRRGETTRELTDAAGDTFVYSYNLRTGALLSLVVGFVSSLLGIGGGIIHVPVMIQVLHFPAHVATATSHYVLVFTAFTGTVVHVLSGDLAGGYARTAALAVGVLSGAQVGARFSRRVNPLTLVRLLGVAMAVVGVRLLVAAVAG